MCADSGSAVRRDCERAAPNVERLSSRHQLPGIPARAATALSWQQLVRLHDSIRVDLGARVVEEAAAPCPGLTRSSENPTSFQPSLF